MEDTVSRPAFQACFLLALQSPQTQPDRFLFFNVYFSFSCSLSAQGFQLDQIDEGCFLCWIIKGLLLELWSHESTSVVCAVWVCISDMSEVWGFSILFASCFKTKTWLCFMLRKSVYFLQALAAFQLPAGKYLSTHRGHDPAHCSRYIMPNKCVWTGSPSLQRCRWTLSKL
jgi:hypothetical protein